MIEITPKMRKWQRRVELFQLIGSIVTFAILVASATILFIHWASFKK